MKRFLRLALIVLAVLGFTGYFAFTTFLFSPLEGDYEYDIASLVSRDVDLFVARADLVEDFDAELGLRRAQELAEGPFGGLADEEALAGLVEQYRTLREQVRTQLEQLPVSAHPLEVFGGRDLGLAAYFDSAVPGGTEWAVVGRCNWVAKGAYAALERPGMFGLEAQGLTAEEVEDDVIKLSGGELTEPMFFTRIRDVIVASNGLRMPSEARGFYASSGQDSFFTSPRYHDEIAKRSENEDDVEVFVRAQGLIDLMAPEEPLLDSRSDRFVEALIARLFTIESASELAGAIGLDRDLVAFDLAGEWDVGRLTDPQRRIYRKDAVDQRDVVRRIGELAPEDAAFVLYAEVDLGELLTQMINSAERAMIDNIVTEIVQPIFGYATIDPLIADFEAAFADRVAIIVGPNRYPQYEDDAPTNDRPTFAWSIALWVDDIDMLYSPDNTRAGLLNKLEDPKHAARLGLEGRDGAPGIYTNKDGGFPLTEYWSPFIAGTGHVSTGVSQGVFLLSNHFRMVGEVFKLQAGSEPNSKVDALADRGDFLAMMNNGPSSLSSMAWFDPAAIDGDLVKVMRRRALDDLESQIDWDVEKPRIQRELLAANFPGERLGALSDDVRAELDMLYLDAADVYRKQFRSERLPQIEADITATLEYLAGIERALFGLRLDDKDFEVDLRLVLSEE